MPQTHSLLHDLEKEFRSDLTIYQFYTIEREKKLLIFPWPILSRQSLLMEEKVIKDRGKDHNKNKNINNQQ